VGKNHFLKNIQEEILKVDAALRRPAEDIAVLDSSASIQSNLIIGSKRKRRLNMPAPTHEERDSLRLQCPQCGNRNLSGCVLISLYSKEKLSI
jgi:hypothetical protein